MAEPASTARQGANLPEFSVSELSSAIKRTLEGAYGYVRLRGEISGFRGAHSSGHCYFTLKDEKARIEAVIWRTTVQGLRVKPAEGLEVIATGRVTTYPGSSKYQIVIDALEPAGIGALMALLEERKKKLGAEGLFDESRKQDLPRLPRQIGVISSPTGAAIRDILHILKPYGYAAEPIPASACGLKYGTNLDRAYGEYRRLMSDPKADPFYVSADGRIDRSTNLTAFLCTDPAKREYDDAANAFLESSTSTGLRDFFEYAKEGGHRGTPH